MREADVVIVGAGLSGLIAAREVLRAGKEPLVLEASDRVGGRILTEEPIPGVFLELGAQWIGDTHHRMEALAAELGIALYQQFEDGETSYEFAGEVLREQVFHDRYAADVADVERVLRRLDAMAETVSVAEPWAALDADTWDRITVAQWYDAQDLTPVGRDLLELYLNTKGGNREQVLETGERLGVDIFINNPVSSYSSGMLKKLSLLLAFTGNPALILLDEPLITIDTRALAVLYDLIREHSTRGVSFCITSHQPLDAEELTVTGTLKVAHQNITLS